MSVLRVKGVNRPKFGLNTRFTCNTRNTRNTQNLSSSFVCFAKKNKIIICINIQIKIKNHRLLFGLFVFWERRTDFGYYA